jgi:hypothetical protein
MKVHAQADKYDIKTGAVELVEFLPALATRMISPFTMACSMAWMWRASRWATTILASAPGLAAAQQPVRRLCFPHRFCLRRLRGVRRSWRGPEAKLVTS